jgi:hypothetical protein
MKHGLTCIHPDGHRIAITSHQTYVCIRCGIETQFLIPNSTECVVHSLITPYSRNARFRELFEKLIGMSNGPRRKDPIWQYLAKGAPYQTPKDVYGAIKLSGLKNKHYSDIHIFCKCFLKNYFRPKLTFPVKILYDRSKRDFDEILFSWHKSKSASFFSYNWVLEKLLHCYKISCYDEYLKRLQCPARRSLYEDLWSDIVTCDALEHLRPGQNGTRLALLGIV